MRRRHRVVPWLALAALVVAAPASAAEGLKIGYVNVNKIVEQAPQAEQAAKKLEAEFLPRDQELRSLRAKVRSLEVDLEKNSLTMAEADRQQKERELLSLKRDVSRSTQEIREDYNLRRNEELAALQKVVSKAIVAIAKEDGYDIILHEGAIFYASDSVDLTDRVLKRLGQP